MPTTQEIFNCVRWKKLTQLDNFLLEDSKILEARSELGNSLLHTAIIFGQFGVARYLIEKGIDLNLKNDKGKTSLHCLANRRNDREDKVIRTMKLMLERGASAISPDSEGNLPLHSALNLENWESAKVLSEYGGFDYKNKNGETPQDIADAFTKPIHQRPSTHFDPQLSYQLESRRRSEEETMLAIL